MSLTHSGVSVMLPVEDVERARTFYVESLGLDFSGTNNEGGAMFALGAGAQLVLLPRPGARPSGSTALSWEVEDVAREVQALEGNGVTFEDYDLPGLRTVDHVADLDGEKAAWFRDPDGHVLCVHQPAG